MQFAGPDQNPALKKTPFESYFPKDENIQQYAEGVEKSLKIFNEYFKEYNGQPQRIFEELIKPTMGTSIISVSSRVKADRIGFDFVRNWVPYFIQECSMPEEEQDPNHKSDMIIKGSSDSNYGKLKIAIDPQLASQRMLEVYSIAEGSGINIGRVASLYYTPTVQGEETFEKRAEKIIEMSNVLDGYNIEAEFRAPPVVLDRIYKHALILQEHKNDPHFDPKELGYEGVAIVVYPKDEADNNGAFMESSVAENLMNLSENYLLIFCEAGNDRQFPQRFRNGGYLPEDERAIKVSNSDPSNSIIYDFGTIGGHGHRTSVMFSHETKTKFLGLFGTEDPLSGHFDIGDPNKDQGHDPDWIKGTLSDCFSPHGWFNMDSCSVNEGRASYPDIGGNIRTHVYPPNLIDNNNFEPNYAALTSGEVARANTPKFLSLEGMDVSEENFRAGLIGTRQIVLPGVLTVDVYKSKNNILYYNGVPAGFLFIPRGSLADYNSNPNTVIEQVGGEYIAQATKMLTSTLSYAGMSQDEINARVSRFEFLLKQEDHHNLYQKVKNAAMDALEGMPKAQKDSCLQFFFGELDRYTKNGSVVVVGDPTWGNNVALNKNKNENRKIADDIKEMIGEPFNAIVDIFFDWTKSLQSLKRDVGEALTYAKENGLPSNTINELETAWNRLNSNSEAEQQKGRDMIKDLAVSSKKNGLYRMLAGKRGIKVNEYTPNGRVSMRINSGSVTNTQFGLDPREQYKPNLKSTAYFNVSISGALATLNLETYITTLFKAANPNADVKVKRETKGFYSVTVSQQPLRPKDSNQIGAEAQIIYFPSPNGPAPAMILLPIKFTPDKPQENKAGNVAEAGMEMTQRITMAPNAITEPSILVFGDPDEIGKRKVVDVYYPAGGPSSRPRPRWDEWHFDDFIRGKLPSERSNTAQTRNDMSSIKISTSNYAQGGIPLTNGAAMTPKATEDISKLAVETTALNESVPWYGLFGRIAPGRAPSGAEINNSIFAAAAKITKPDGMSDLEYIPLVAKEAAQQTQKMQRTFSSGGPLDNLFGSYLNYRVSTTLPGVDSYTKGVFASEFAGKLAHNVLTGGDPINTRMLMSTIQNGMQHFLDSNQVNMKIDQVQITDHVFIGGTIGLNPQGTMFGGQYNIQGATTAFLEFTYYYQKPLILGKYPLAMDFKFNLKAAMIGLPEGTILQGWYGAGDETYKVAGTLKSGKTIFAPLPDITLGLTYYATKTEQEKVSLSAGLRFIAPPATVSLFMPNKEAFFKQAPEFRRWSPGADLYLDAVVRESEDIYGKLSLGLTGLPEGIRFSYLSLDVKGQTPSSIYTLPIGVEGRIGGYLNAKEEMPYYSNAGGLIFSANLGVNLIHTVKVEGIPPFDIIIYGGYNSSATSVPNVGIGSLNYGLTVQMKSPLGLMVNSSP